MMGDDNGEFGREKPAHQVLVSGFWMGKYPVTQRLWQAVMKNNPSNFTGERRPVEQVSWNDAQEFLARLNQLTEKKFRLPTGAEWEYAARGGRFSQGYKYAGSDRANQVAWHEENSQDKTHEVGLLLPNELGLCDMSGNVWEWCGDLYSVTYYAACHQQGFVANPQGPGLTRVKAGFFVVVAFLTFRMPAAIALGFAHRRSIGAIAPAFALFFPFKKAAERLKRK